MLLIGEEVLEAILGDATCAIQAEFYLSDLYCAIADHRHTLELAASIALQFAVRRA